MKWELQGLSSGGTLNLRVLQLRKGGKKILRNVFISLLKWLSIMVKRDESDVVKEKVKKYTEDQIVFTKSRILG